MKNKKCSAIAVFAMALIIVMAYDAHIVAVRWRRATDNIIMVNGGEYDPTNLFHTDPDTHRLNVETIIGRIGATQRYPDIKNDIEFKPRYLGKYIINPDNVYTSQGKNWHYKRAAYYAGRGDGTLNGEREFGFGVFIERYDTRKEARESMLRYVKDSYEAQPRLLIDSEKAHRSGIGEIDVSDKGSVLFLRGNFIVNLHTPYGYRGDIRPVAWEIDAQILEEIQSALIASGKGRLLI